MRTKNSAAHEAERDGRRGEALTHAITRLTDALGSFPAIFLAVGVVLIWVVTGPVFNYSDTWQLIINTGTTVVTFCMVFIIQNTQNRDGRAIQTKLDALLRASAGADEELMGLEDLPERSIKNAQAAVHQGHASSPNGVGTEERRGYSGAGPEDRSQR